MENDETTINQDPSCEQEDCNCGQPPSEELPTEVVKPVSKALDIADGLLMIIFAFALYAEIYSVFLYAWN